MTVVADERPEPGPFYLDKECSGTLLVEALITLGIRRTRALGPGLLIFRGRSGGKTHSYEIAAGSRVEWYEGEMTRKIWIKGPGGSVIARVSVDYHEVVQLLL